jgi:hypothetical protein
MQVTKEDLAKVIAEAKGGDSPFDVMVMATAGSKVPGNDCIELASPELPGLSRSVNLKKPLNINKGV